MARRSSTRQAVSSPPRRERRGWRAPVAPRHRCGPSVPPREPPGAPAGHRPPRAIWRVAGRGASLRSREPEKLIASSQGEANPAYSPDGRRIAFESGRSGVNNIWLCDSDGRNPVQLTSFERATGHTSLVARRSQARLRLARGGGLEHLRRRRRRRRAAPPDAGAFPGACRDLVPGWPLDLLPVESKRQPGDLEDAVRGRSCGPGDADRRSVRPGIVGRPVPVLHQVPPCDRDLENCPWTGGRKPK